ncbi:MAG TPA: hypothetical protein VFZ08_16735, partial [Terriglobia bacterium]|nr:hypothetical protein [Terriglobia bacterium]
FKDRLKELGLEAAKLATEVNPFTMIFGGGARDAIQKQIDQLATNESIARSDMMRGLQAITIPGTGVGAGTLHLGLTGANGAKYHIDKVAGALRELKDQLTGLSQGSVAQGLAKLRDLGATPAQLTEGKNILNQIQSFKAAQKAAQDYSGALHEEIGTQKSLAMATSGLSSAQQEYLETVAKLNTLELKGVDITHSLALAREQYREALIAAHPAGLQGPAPDKMPLDTFFSQDSMVKFNKLNEQAKQLGQTMQSSFVGMIVEGQSFGNVLKNLTTLFAEFLLKAVVFKGLSNAFGTTGFSGLIGSFFGGLEGGRATGGPVTAGSLYMVGESGPELFSPGISGSIIPNSSLAASRGSGNIVNIDARGADAGVEARVMRAMAAMKKQTLGQSLVMNYEYQARGGTL